MSLIPFRARSLLERGLILSGLNEPQARQAAANAGRLPRRFWRKIEITKSGCLRWTAGVDKDGYARFWHAGKTQRASRVVYSTLIGPIGDGLHIDHTCRTRDCVNPAHLEPVTCRENLMRGDTFAARYSAKTSCKRGHALNGANLRIDTRGRRQCRRCACIHSAANRARKRAAA